MADNQLTAAELRAIRERVNNYGDLSLQVAPHDRASLCAALERLIEAYTISSPTKCAYMDANGDVKMCDTKDAAIDALLGQGGGE